MKLWLVSFLILFFGAEAIQWVLQFHWFSGVELSLPVVVMGGIGLAIASNYRQFQALGLLPEIFPASDMPVSQDCLPELTPESKPPQVADSQPAVVGALRKKEHSISFKVSKPKPVSFEIKKPRKS